MNIEFELQRWGAWASDHAGLNIKPLILFNSASTSAPRSVMTDEEAELFDPAIAALKKINEDQFQLIRLRYMHGLSFHAIGLIKKSNKAIIYNELNKAQSFIHGYLTGYHRAFDELALSSL